MNLGSESVRCLVSLKVSLLPERLVAKGTAEGSNILVHAHVDNLDKKKQN